MARSGWVVAGLGHLRPLNPRLFLRHRPPCHGRWACDLQGFRIPEFTVAIRDGALALALGIVLCLAWRWWRDRAPAGRARTAGGGGRARAADRPGRQRPLPIAGVLLAVAAVAALWETGHLVVGLGMAVALLLASGLVADGLAAPRLARAALALPGGWVLAEHAALPDPTWARLLVWGVAVAGSVLVTDFDRRHADAGLGPVLMAVTMVGLYETLPDTDLALLLLGAAAPLFLLGWPVPLARLGGGGGTALVGLLAWVAAVGGRGRVSAVVAGVLCLGLFAIEPLARWLDPRARSALAWAGRAPWGPLAAGLVQLCAVAAATRVPGPERSPELAGLVAAVELAVGIALALVVARARPRRRRSAPRPPGLVGDPAPRR